MGLVRASDGLVKRWIALAWMAARYTGGIEV
jgi:hypothetical protein